MINSYSSFKTLAFWHTLTHPQPQTELSTSLVHLHTLYMLILFHLLTYLLVHFMGPSPLELHLTPLGLWVS